MRRNPQRFRRASAVAALCAGVVVTAALFLGASGSGYTVWLTFRNASQLIVGNDVVMGGAPIGRVHTLRLLPDGQVAVAISVDSGLYRPLRQGTRAVVRYTSLSGEASRYIDLQPPGLLEQGGAIPDGGHISTANTTSAVELDSLFALFDAPTRQALRGVVSGLSNLYGGKSAPARLGFEYLNPALVAANDLFGELNRDTPALRNFVVASSHLVANLGASHLVLTTVVQHAARMMHAIGTERVALTQTLARLPDFLTTADRTFTDLRGTLDYARPIVHDAIPLAVKLNPFMTKLRFFSIAALPAMRDLAELLVQPGPGNDLVDLTRSAVPLSRIALGPVTRDGGSRPGGFPASTQAIQAAIPELAFLRPYTVDLGSSLDVFGHGGPYDALRRPVPTSAQVDIPALATAPTGLSQQTISANGQTLVINQRNRCPLSLERGTVWKPTPSFDCDPRQVPPGK